METFTPGDFVLIVHDPIDKPEFVSFIGKIGLIKSISVKSFTSDHLAIEFSEKFHKGHDCEGLVKDGQGYYIKRSCVLKVIPAVRFV